MKAVVDRGTSASWTFKPVVALDELSPEERSTAAKLYKSVTMAAADNIDAMIANEFLVAVSKWKCLELPDDLKNEVRMAWLKKNYIMFVERVLDDMWTFSPMVPVESLPESEREAVAKIYATVDKTAAMEIAAAVEHEISMMSAKLPPNSLSVMHERFRDSWIRENYIQVVSRVTSTRSLTSAVPAEWTFTPALSIAELPRQDQSRAATVYAAVTRDAEP